MKIAYVFDQVLPDAGADTEQALNTISALGRAGSTITLVLPRARDASADLDADALRAHYQVTGQFEVHHLRSYTTSWRPLDKGTHALTASLSEILRQHDLLYTRNIAAMMCGLALGHDVVYETYRPWPRNYRVLGPMFRMAVSRSRFVAAVFHSEYALTSYLDAGVPADKLTVVHNGHDPARFTPPDDRAALRASLGLPVDRPLFLYTGRVAMAKGLGIVLDMARRNTDALFVIIGSLGHGEVEQEASTIDNVRVLARLPFEEIPPYLLAADVLVIPPSLVPLEKDGSTVLPMKLFPYLAAGRAILAPDLPDTAELLQHGLNAHLVPADDLEACSRAVRMLIDQPERTAELGSNARELGKNLTWDARAHKILEFIDQRQRARHGMGSSS